MQFHFPSQPESFVPVQGHQWNGDDLVLPFEKDVIKDAPNVDADGLLDENEQARLFEYYSGHGVSTEGNRTTTDANRDDAALAGDVRGDRDVNRDRDQVDANEDLVAREERLRVGKTAEESGHVRLRKYTTTENQQVNVPVTKEKVTIEREPVAGDRAVPGGIDADARDEVVDITTREERPVVGKETVETERVSVNKETYTENETVAGDVAKEHIEVDENATRQRGDVDRDGNPLT